MKSDSPSLVFYDPKVTPPEEMRSGFAPSGLAPGEYALIQNMRWEDNRMTARKGTISTLPLPTVGATIVDSWQGTLNGSNYIVAAFNVSTETRIYASAEPYTSWSAELTGADTFFGTAGNSRFPTNSTRVSFAPIKSPRYSDGSTYSISHDYLIIQNGLSVPRQWDSAAYNSSSIFLSTADPVTLPANYKEFRAQATFTRFFQVASASGKTYAASAGPPKVNQTNFVLANTLVAPYTSANAVIGMTVGVAIAATDIATVQFSTSVTFGTQAVFLVEGADLGAIVNQMKVEICSSSSAYSAGATWVTIFDPSDTTGLYAKLVKPIDVGNNRYLLVYKLQSVTGSLVARHIRWTWQGAAPTVAKGIKFLMVASSGPFAGASGWGISYGDSFAHTESPGIVPNDTTPATLAVCGGPTTVSTTTISDLTLPLYTDVFYDYFLTVANPTTANSIVGGLNGTPAVVNLYYSTPEELAAGIDPYFITSTKLYQTTVSTPCTWDKIFKTSYNIKLSTATYLDAYGLTAASRDFQRQLPSSYQITIPTASLCFSANGRLYSGDVLDNSHRVYGDLYYSAQGNGFRNQAIPVDDISPGRLTFAGEALQTMAASAAAANGASLVYVFTDQAVYALGTSNYTGGSQTSFDFQRPVRIASQGTRAPRSVAETNGLIFYLDTTGQVRVISNGQAQPISRLRVDDKLSAIPAARRAYTRGAFFNDRYYLAYTPEGDSTNSRCLVWNNVRFRWEADDLPPVSFETLGVAYDSTTDGSGLRLFAMGSDSIGYMYEEGLTDLAADIPVRLTFRTVQTMEVTRSLEQGITIENVLIVADPQDNSLTIDRVYNPGVTTRNTFDLSNGWGIDKATPAPTTVLPSGFALIPFQAYLDIYGDITSGTSIYHISAKFSPTTAKGAKAS